MTSFDLGPGVACDLQKLIDTRLLVQANSGGGKSHLLRRLLEQTHGRVQHLVIDPEGEFATLRERFDYVLAARQQGDTVADPRSAKLLAERLLELGVSAILDIYELKAHDRIRFVRHFIEALVEAPKALWHPALVVIDEAHVFCPQQGEAESAGAVIDLATRGRKRGFCAVLATQRLSKLHKDAAAECNNKLIGRTGLDVDMKRAADELGLVGREEVHRLRQLEPGEFFAFGPAIAPAVRRIRVGSVQTTHPKAGSRIAFTPPPPTAKVRALLPRLADLPAEAEQRARSIEELQKELAGVRRQLTIAQRGAPVAPPKEKIVEKRVEVAVLKDGQLVRLEKVADRVGAAGAELVAFGREFVQALAKLSGNGNGRHVTMSRHLSRPTVSPTSSLSRADRGSVRRSVPPQAPLEGLNRPQQRILDALAWLEGVGLPDAERPQLGFLADASSRSSAFMNNLGALRSAGLITYPREGRVGLTEAGRAAANVPDAPLTPEELQRMVLAKVTRPQGRILEALIAVYPDNLTREQLGEAADASTSSSAFMNNLGFLRGLGLIDYPGSGKVAACPVLFLEH